MKKLRQITTVKRHVLIVDDEVVNREILGNITTPRKPSQHSPGKTSGSRLSCWTCSCP